MPSTAFKKWVCRHIEAIQDYLNLQDWRIGLSFDDTDEADGNIATVASIEVSTDYFKAHISFRPFAERLFKAKDYETLHQCLVHEVCHILTDPLLQLAKKSASPTTVEFVTTANEQLTQRITLLVLRGIPAKSYLPKE